MKRGPRWKRQQWTVARAAAVLAGAIQSGRGKVPNLADLEKRFGIGLRELMHLNARLGQNEDLSGSSQLALELRFDGDTVRAIGADRLSQLTRLTRVQAAFAAQALRDLAVEGPLKTSSAALADRLAEAAGEVDDQLLIYRPSEAGPLRAKISMLHEALRQKRTVAFEYRGPSSKSAGRVLDPLSLRRDQGVWRVLGWDHQRGALRTFNLIHLTKLIITAKPFEWPRGLKPDVIQSKDLSVFEASGKEIKAKLRVSARVAEDWASALKAQGKPDKDGFREVTILAGNHDWVLRTFLGRANEIRVLGPPALKTAWQKALQDILAQALD